MIDLMVLYFAIGTLAWAIAGGIVGFSHIMMEKFPRRYDYHKNHKLKFFKSAYLFFIFGPAFWIIYITWTLLWPFRRLYMWAMKD